ncbi:hypothetical protein VTO42DRAFT_7090 [Malbranchea cinnamomea]
MRVVWGCLVQSNTVTVSWVTGMPFEVVQDQQSFTSPQRALTSRHLHQRFSGFCFTLIPPFLVHPKHPTLSFVARYRSSPSSMVGMEEHKEIKEILTRGEQRLINVAFLCNPEGFGSIKVRVLPASCLHFVLGIASSAKLHWYRPTHMSAHQVDYAMLAEKAGFKNAESARANFGKAKRKLMESAGYAGGVGTAKTPSPSKVTPKKVTKKTKDGPSPTKGKGMSLKLPVREPQDVISGRPN